MKKLSAITLLLLLFSCGSSDDGNTLLPNVPVNVTLNLNLPVNQNLLINNGSRFVPGHGIKGIIVFRLSETNFFAWEAACPHITPNNCSTMVINGVKMVCNCDDSEFSILDGSPLSGTPFSARQYRAVKTGNSVMITNF